MFALQQSPDHDYDDRVGSYDAEHTREHGDGSDDMESKKAMITLTLTAVTVQVTCSAKDAPEDAAGATEMIAVSTRMMGVVLVRVIAVT